MTNANTTPINFEVACEAIDIAKARVQGNRAITEGQKGDWLRAINKAAGLLLGLTSEDAEPMRSVEFDAGISAIVFRDEAGEIKYVANGSCQCPAYREMSDEAGMRHACYHRAMARIVAIHQEIIEQRFWAAAEARAAAEELVDTHAAHMTLAMRRAA